MYIQIHAHVKHMPNKKILMCIYAHSHMYVKEFAHICKYIHIPFHIYWQGRKDSSRARGTNVRRYVTCIHIHIYIYMGGRSRVGGLWHMCMYTHLHRVCCSVLQYVAVRCSVSQPLWHMCTFIHIYTCTHTPQ